MGNNAHNKNFIYKMFHSAMPKKPNLESSTGMFHQKSQLKIGWGWLPGMFLKKNLMQTTKDSLANVHTKWQLRISVAKMHIQD